MGTLLREQINGIPLDNLKSARYTLHKVPNSHKGEDSGKTAEFYAARCGNCLRGGTGYTDGARHQ